MSLFKIELPKTQDLQKAAQLTGGSVEVGLVLSPTERQLFDILYAERPYWVDGNRIFCLVWGDPAGWRLKPSKWHKEGNTHLHVLRVHLTRLRKKLQKTPWKIETLRANGAYRLINLTEESVDEEA